MRPRGHALPAGVTLEPPVFRGRPKPARRGLRGLPGGSSLARLLAERRGVRNHLALPKMTIAGILAWADAHHARTGRWPGRASGAIADAPGETWTAVDGALAHGGRGLR